jgi:hypothetical protein
MLPVYAMGALLLPSGMIEPLDARRRVSFGLVRKLFQAHNAW